MPKIIENIREQLMAEARRQIAERGYARTTIRSVAAECGIAAGTVYNYFPSKEMLIASFMAEDWTECLARMRADSIPDPEEHLRGICNAITDFSEKHRALFSDTDAEKTFAEVFPARHRQLRAQLAELAAHACPDLPGTKEGFAAQFIAEAILTWTTEGVPFDMLWPLLAGIIRR